MRALRLAVVLHFVCLSLCSAGQGVVPYGKPFGSPDGRFTAVLPTPPDGEVDRLSISDARTGERAAVGVLTPLLSLRWSGDSQTLVTVEHLAGGSQAALLRRRDGKWERREVEPPGDFVGHYAVVRQQIGAKTLTLTYKLTHEKPNGQILSFHRCTFRVDCATGATLEVLDTRKISVGAYRRLTSGGTCRQSQRLTRRSSRRLMAGGAQLVFSIPWRP